MPLHQIVEQRLLNPIRLHKLTNEADDVALILHTSGTTSRPKIVPLLQRNIYSVRLNDDQDFPQIQEVIEMWPTASYPGGSSTAKG